MIELEGVLERAEKQDEDRYVSKKKFSTDKEMVEHLQRVCTLKADDEVLFDKKGEKATGVFINWDEERLAVIFRNSIGGLGIAKLSPSSIYFD